MFWVWRCYGLLWTLHCPKHRYCDVTMIWPLFFRGIRADVSETPDNALTTRMHGDYIHRFFVGFNAICYIFLRNNPIYIEGRNCRLNKVPGLFNKCSGFHPRTPLSSWWLGWRRHAAADFPRDVCLTVSRNHTVFLLYHGAPIFRLCHMTALQRLEGFLRNMYAFFIFLDH